MKTVLVGNLTIDENVIGAQIYRGPGGSVFFIAKTFENLDVFSTIISPYGEDFPKGSLPKTRFIPKKPLYQKTLVFKNKYNGVKREQWVKNYKEFLLFDSDLIGRELILNFSLRLKNIDIVIIAPVLNNIDLHDIKKIREYFSKSFFCLLPQGFYRRIDNQGRVYKSIEDTPEDILKYFDFICFSTEDITHPHETGMRWSKIVPLVIITKAEKGSVLYEKGEKTSMNAFYITNVIDPTGAGDVFAAAFVYAYCKSKDSYQSMRFANAVSAISLLCRSDKLQYNYLDVINFAAGQRQKILL